MPACNADQPSLATTHPPPINRAAKGSTITLVGCGFDQKKTQVNFDGIAHQSLVLDQNHIRIGILDADVAKVGTTTITLLNANDNKPFGTASLKVIEPTMQWSWLSLGPTPLTRETQLLLLILFVGAFGASISALKSLADFLGNRDYLESWLLYYLIQPFEGAGVAFLLYVAVRAGFFGPSSLELTTLNQFGFCTFAGLGGAFSDKTFIKLGELFTVLFKPRDDRSDKLSLKISPTRLPDGAVNSAYNAKLNFVGGRSPLTWTVAALPAGLKLDAAAGTISGTPTAQSKADYQFTVTDSTGASATANISLEIK